MPMQINPVINDIVAERFFSWKKTVANQQYPHDKEKVKKTTGITYTEETYQYMFPPNIIAQFILGFKLWINWLDGGKEREL
jgi:hypothetical protein